MCAEIVDSYFVQPSIVQTIRVIFQILTNDAKYLSRLLMNWTKLLANVEEIVHKASGTFDQWV